MTYNVHRCVGGDGVLSPRRIAGVIDRFQPDVVGLQELDVGHARTGRHDQPRMIAEMLKMRCVFFPAIRAEDEHYGDAVLSRHPLELVRAGPLPTLPGRPGLERRGAVWVRVQVGSRSIQVINTHLGLLPRERLAQVEALLGPEWLGDARCRPPHVVCGDFNAWPGSRAYGWLAQRLRDGQRSSTRGVRATWPARCPLLTLDHVFLSHEFTVHAARIPRTRLTRLASDHLPVIVEASLP
jgi:endonuclease/exonuclease/phosphatase family metal-dependent hydrolase